MLMLFSILLGGGSWNGSVKAADFDANGTSPIFPSVMPSTDEVKYAAEHFSVALSSLKVVSYSGI